MIQGTPTIGKSTDNAGNTYIYFTHNHNMNAIDSSGAYGSFSVMQESTGDVIFTENAGNSTSDPEPGRLDTLQVTYGPVGIAQLPLFGRYPGGLDNSNDLLLWSTSIENGEGPNGYTRAFQIPSPFSPDFAGTLRYITVCLALWLILLFSPTPVAIKSNPSLSLSLSFY